jgi:glutathione S-transferase
MDEVALFHAEPASNSLKVLQALHEKSVAFISHYVDLTKFEQHDPDYLKVNPAGQVPALRHRGRVLTESTVINEYVDAVFAGPPLRPADPYLRGQMRIWTKYVDEVFRPALSFLAWHRVIPGMVATLSAEEFEAKLARIPSQDKRDKWAMAARGGFAQNDLDMWTRHLRETAERVEAALDGREWLVESGFSLADIAVFAMAHGMARTYPELVSGARTPRMVAWIDRMRARPGVAAALAMPNRSGF